MIRCGAARRRVARREAVQRACREQRFQGGFCTARAGQSAVRALSLFLPGTQGVSIPDASVRCDPVSSIPLVAIPAAHPRGDGRQGSIRLLLALLLLLLNPPPSPARAHAQARDRRYFLCEVDYRMVLKKVLQLFGVVKKKDSKKKAAAPHSTVNVNANNSLLDPCSSGTGTVLSLQKHEPECSSIISSTPWTVHGSDTDDCMPFNQFDVVQDFSDHHYAKHSPGKTTKDWVKTIQNEWKLLQKDLPGSIYVRVYEDRIDLLRAAIVGPAGTPYHDGLFFFDIRFPAEYPRCPPKVHYHSGGLRLNPNLYESGKVCLSLLNTWWGTGCERWGKSNSTVLQVLVSIQGLVLNDKPYFNEPGNKNSANTAVGEKNSLAYNRTAFLLSCKTMLYSLRKPPKHFETLVVCHFHERERFILDSCGAYMSGTVVGSSVGNGTKYPCDKCFADFKRSLEQYTEHLTKELAANRIRVLEPKRGSAADEIVSISQNSFVRTPAVAIPLPN